MKKEFKKNLKNSIETLKKTTIITTMNRKNMPDFRKLAMGLRGDIDANQATVGTFIDNETPTGTMDSSNKTFTLANTPISGSVKLYLNGTRLTSGVGYSISGATITMTFAPDSGEELRADYRK